MKKFLEKNYKWISSALLLIGLYLIIKLFLVGFHMGGCGGGWISICIVPSMEYYFISASYIAILLLAVSVYLIYIIKKIENKTKKIQIALLILFLGLIGKQIFFVVSPDFKFYLNHAEYKDENNNLVDIDKYLELVTKYCINKGDFDFYDSRQGMCGGKFEPKLKTVDEYIKVFETAKKNDFKYLYYLTYRFADENVGLENIIEKYNDDTFYAYVIFEGGIKMEQLDFLKTFIKNDKLISLYDFYYNSLIKNQKLMISDKNHDVLKFWENYEKDLNIKIKNIPEINQKIF